MIGWPICGGVDAQLMGAAGIGLHLQPGEVLAGLLDDAVVGDGVVGAVFAVLGDAHAVAVRRLFLDQPGGDLVFALARHALDQRPVGLLGVALAEGRRQLLRGATGAGDHQDAGGVAVEPVDEARLFALRAGPGLEHLVDVPVDAGAALDGDARPAC